MISIIIPTYNRRLFLEQLIESILSQSYKDIEIIVVDDCSTDNTEELFKTRYERQNNIIYIRNVSNKGPGFNRKKGYNISKGNYVIFADDDDYYTDTSFFQLSVNFLEDDESLAFVSGNVSFLKEDVDVLVEDSIKLDGKILKDDYLRNFQVKWRKPISTFSTVFKKIHLDRFNFKEMVMVNDSSIYLRALLSGNAYILKNNIGVYRIHNQNITKSLNVKFILDNLQEKNNIYQIIKNKHGFESWYNKQVLVTLGYFFKENEIGIYDFIEILKIINKNELTAFSNLKIILKYFKYKFK